MGATTEPEIVGGLRTRGLLRQAADQTAGKLGHLLRHGLKFREAWELV